MNLLNIVLCFAIIAFAKGSVLPDVSKVRYDNYSVLKVYVQNENQRNLVKGFLEQHPKFDVWFESPKEFHVMVSPRDSKFFENFTRSTGLSVKPWIANVQSLIDAAEDSSAKSGIVDWRRYNTLHEIYNWLDGILQEYSEVTESFVIGKSFEGRNIRGIKISYKEGNPGIFIESNIHAREWITSATATWFINELLTSEDPQVRQLAENYDWYIIPVLNVDGFVYSHEKDRMWRKTRQPVASSPCIGTDPNRNFDSHWMYGGGASDNPCSSSYGGPKPYSEPEIKALDEYMQKIKSKINILIAFHSYSQMLLSPYGWTGQEVPENHDDLVAVAAEYAKAVKALPYETNYTYGATAPTLYVASGATNDWAYSEHDIKLSYTIEFRDLGNFGFVLPPIQIIPNCDETMAGMIAFVNKARDLGYLTPKYMNN